jgi:membrane-bound serine protease (ClpP class)
MIGSLALLGGAVLLFLLEIFVPSGGILALICAACVVASVVVMFMYNGMLGVLMLVGYIVVIPVALYWGIRIWERSPLGRKLILGAEEEWTTSEESLARSEDARQDRVSSIKELIGQVGITDSSLRPIGFVRIAGQRLDAIAEGDMIEAGQSVKVVDAYDNQLKVRPVDAQDESKPESG